MNLYSKRPGVGLMEMMLVLGIVIFLASVIMPRVGLFFVRINKDKTKIILSKVYSGISRYTQDMGHPPLAEEGGINALIHRPKGPAGKDWQGSYLPGETNIPLDGFKKDFYYASPPRKFKGVYKKFELYSMGDDEDNDASNDLRTGD